MSERVIHGSIQERTDFYQSSDLRWDQILDDSIRYILLPTIEEKRWLKKQKIQVANRSKHTAVAA